MVKRYFKTIIRNSTIPMETMVSLLLCQKLLSFFISGASIALAYVINLFLPAVGVRVYKHLGILSNRFHRLNDPCSHLIGVCGGIWSAILQPTLPSVLHGRNGNSYRRSPIRNSKREFVDGLGFVLAGEP